MATIVDILRYVLDLDSTGLQAGAKQAEARVSSLASQISGQLKGAVMGLAGAYFGAQGLRAVFDWTIGGALESEKAFGRLEGQLETQGYRWDQVSGQVQAFATSLSIVTKYTDEELADAMRSAGTYTASLTRQMDIVSAATDLAAAKDMSLATAVELLGKASKGHTETLARYGLILDEGTVQGSKFEAIMGLINRQFSGAAQKEIENTEGKIRSLKKAWGELGEALGSGKPMPFSPGDVTGWVESVTWFLQWLNGKMTEEGFIGPVKNWTDEADEIDEVALRAAHDRRVAFEELYYSLKLRTAEQMTALYRQELETFKDNAQIKEAILKRLFQLELDIERRYAEIEARGMRLQGGRRTTPSQGGGLVGGFIGPMPSLAYDPAAAAQAEQITLWDQMWNEIRVHSESGADALIGIFDGLMGQLSGTVRGTLDMITSAMTGDFYSAALSFVNNFVAVAQSVFGSNARAAQLHQQAMEQMRQEYERATQAIYAMTEAQKESRQAFLEAELAAGNQEFILSRQYQERQQELEYYRNELEALSGLAIDTDALRGLESVSDFIGYLNGNAANIDADTASRLMAHVTRMLGLSPEEQLALWQQIKAILEANGNYTLDQMWRIDETMKELADTIAEEKKLEEKQGESQTMRSVTTITERQANNMLAVLNSIHAELRNILNAITGQARGVMNGQMAGGTSIAFGPNYWTVASENPGKQVLNDIVREARGRGIQISLS